MIDLTKIIKEKPISELINFSIINMDKPTEWTSFDVVDYVRKALGLRKAGHFGTLDPKVTGVLPIGLGKAVRVQKYFMGANKTYIGTMHLHTDISKTELEAQMKEYLGVIKQLPPRKSRVKRQVREREVLSFKILNKTGRDADFRTEVQAGTYIRKLISDLGTKIKGAHMIKLRRTKAGIFSEEQSTTMDEFKQAVSEYKDGKDDSLRRILVPAESITSTMPIIEIDADSRKLIRNGSPIFKEMVAKEPREEVFALAHGNELVAIARKTTQFKNPDIIAKSETVLK